MPLYEYDCDDCGLRFELLRKLSEHLQPAVCPECGQTIGKIMSPTNHSFAHQPVGGPRPQNTGVYSIDYNADRVIGRDAAQRWEAISQRQADKRRLLADNPGKTGHDLSRNEDGSYRVMKPEERRAVETARTIHKQAQEALKPKSN